jgi:histidyl-tRNA synthetase
VLAAALAEHHGVTERELPGVLAALDKYDKSPEAAEEGLERALGGGAGGGGPASGRARALLAFFASLEDPAALLELDAAGPLRECVAALGAMGLGAFVDVDFRIVRGLAYYTGVVFELFDAKRALRAICGGGRYDDLLKQVGGVDLPCAGFGMGDVVLGELLAERGALPATPPVVQVFVAVVGDEDRPAALGLAHALRERGVRVEFALRRQALGKQLELAAARGAQAAVVIGPEERAAGQAVVRTLATGAERRVPISQLAADYDF